MKSSWAGGNLVHSGSRPSVKDVGEVVLQLEAAGFIPQAGVELPVLHEWVHDLSRSLCSRGVLRHSEARYPVRHRDVEVTRREVERDRFAVVDALFVPNR